MILRISAKLGKKIHLAPDRILPADLNPFADWSAHLFTADRTQYVLISNTISLERSALVVLRLWQSKKRF